ncbi:FecCD family ABC transporter permease [Fluviispira vulneris]|uniref:FecCD family ABC transporter permease n=1 Tax=Fluviispira vulneris TaxID=2763012 RepID=UPI00256FB81A|nr:iron ABC transporter permease [Fluviispira vulneris]
MLLSLAFGSVHIEFSRVWKYLFQNNSDMDSIIINTLRLPRTALAALIGANLAVAGALMQCLTRNPLAEAKIMGVSAGASLVFVLISFFQLTISQNLMTLFIFMGAAIGGGFVYLISITKRQSIGKLVLAGVSISSFLYALSTGMLISLGENAGMIYAWLAGGLAGVTWEHLSQIFPWSFCALASAFIFSHFMNAYSLGDDIAKSLGLNLWKIRTILCVLIIILAGASVSVSGAIGFIGLIVPHIVRKLISDDYKIMLPFCAIFGAFLLVLSDLIARVILKPIEIPVGVITAFLGCPFFLYLIRKHGDKAA